MTFPPARLEDAQTVCAKCGHARSHDRATKQHKGNGCATDRN
jgi:hypothetical protein